VVVVGVRYVFIRFIACGREGNGRESVADSTWDGMRESSCIVPGLWKILGRRWK